MKTNLSGPQGLYGPGHLVSDGRLQGVEDLPGHVLPVDGLGGGHVVAAEALPGHGVAG